jgi:DNA-binding LacI/PurR family transcriptional regulator
VASVHFGSGFGAVMTSLLKKHVQPGHPIIECQTQLDESDLSCRGLLQLLERSPPPSAVIGISVRPGPDVVAAFRSQSIPMVLIDEEAEGATTIACDNLAGGHLAGQHLARIGRRAPAVVCGKRDIAGGLNAVLRVRGFERALIEAGLSLPGESVLEVPEYARKDGVVTMIELLKRKTVVDAIFCAAGDLCAMGMVSVARQQHVRIPEAIAVIGFDDHPMSGVCEPPLTTIRQPLERIAAEACRLATAETAAIHARPQKMLLEPELVLRRSA